MVNYLKKLPFLMLILFNSVHAQNKINIDYCLEKAKQFHPRQGNQQIINDISSNRISNAKAGYLPQVELNGLATYQSDVVSIDIELPVPGIEFPVAPKDQYKLSLDVSQAIYDGGISRNRQKIEKAGNETEIAQLDLEIHNTLVQVKDLYFNVLILQKNEKALEIPLSQLMENHKIIKSGIEKGVALETDSDLILVEEINLEQKIGDLKNTRNAVIKMLGDRINQPLDTNVYLEFTSYEFPVNSEINRREKIIFDLQKNQLEQNKALLKAQKLPVVYGFGQFGYGNPGLNMLNDQFDTYYLIGAKLKWNILDWNTTKRNQGNLGLQQNLLESSEQKFEQDIRSALINQEAIVKNHRDNIQRCERILDLRSGITKKYSAQLNEGVIRIVDLVSAINQENSARMQLETEKVLLQQSIAKYLELKGDL
jgi:outer membrane protein TolC